MPPHTFTGATWNYKMRKRRGTAKKSTSTVLLTSSKADASGSATRLPALASISIKQRATQSGNYDRVIDDWRGSHASGLTALIGREEEIELLFRRRRGRRLENVKGALLAARVVIDDWRGVTRERPDRSHRAGRRNRIALPPPVEGEDWRTKVALLAARVSG
jgi:hypothetical protein